MEVSDNKELKDNRMSFRSMFRGRQFFCSMMICMLMSAAMFSGCGGKDKESQEAQASSETVSGSSAEAKSNSVAETEASSAEPDVVVSLSEDGFYHVSSVEELLEAIRPGVGIIIEQGYYDISEYAEKFWNGEKYDRWRATHCYVALQQVYDGTEIVIQNCPDLHIEGAKAAEGSGEATFADGSVELVVVPRFATVLNFMHCNNLELSNLVMGHTDTGDCAGDVIRLENSKNVRLDHMDLYGCGVIGITAFDSQEIHVSDSVIHDCEYGPVDIENCTGEIVFQNCSFTDSRHGGYYYPTEESTLSFINCHFGTTESEEWQYREDIVTQDCTWSD